MQEDRTTIESQSDNAPEPHEYSSALPFSEPTTADLLGLDNIVPTNDALLTPPSTMNKLDITHTSLLDTNQEPSVTEHDPSIMPGMQPRRPAPAAAEAHDFPPLESEVEIFPSPTTLKGSGAVVAAETEIGTETQIEANENGDEETTETAVEHNQFHSWSSASERVVMGAIRCLTETKDMELSYVSLLSAITILNSRHTDNNDHERVDGGEPTVVVLEGVSEVAAAIGAEDPVEKLYTQLLGIMTRPNVVEDLDKETMRQGAISPDALYIRLYKAILNAGYRLQVRFRPFLFCFEIYE